MADFKIHNDFSDLDFLFDSESTDIVADITKKRFKENLLFAIIETVTISRVKGIGTTQYLSYKKVDFIEKTIHKDYLEIIEEIKGTAFGSPIQYYDWYKRDKFYYAIGVNKNAKPTVGTILNTTTIPPKDEPDSNEYIKEYDRVLTDSEIRNFFSDYAECLLAKDWFKELPHYFILVKPISIQDKETKLYIPLGNLYLKIGTKEKVDLIEYKKYVNHLKSVWFNKFGDKVLKEYSQKKTSDEYKPKISLHNNLEKKFSTQLFKVDTNPITLNDFFYFAFDLDANKLIRDEYLIYSKNPLIKQLLPYYNNKKKIQELIKAAYDYKPDPKNIITRNIKGLKSTNDIKVEGIKYFLLLLSKRRIALLLLLVFNFTEEETHECITFGEKATTTTSDSVQIYLRENLFIYPGKNFNLPLLADRENLFLRNIISEIRKIKPTFSCLIPD